MPGRRPTGILADDHPMMLEGLRKLLEPLIEVLETASDGQALLQAATRLRPDLVLADVSMPLIDGIEATRRLLVATPATKVVILSCHREGSWVRAAFEAGACGYLTKAAAPDEIEGAIREVLAGRFYVSPSATHAPVALAQAPAALEALTPREQEVVRLVGQGLPNKEIAHSLGVSVTTVRTHLRNAYDKLGWANRVELALHAGQHAGAEA